jgi:hypothetical protein
MSVPLQLPTGDTFICNVVLTERFTKPDIYGLDILDKVPSFSSFIEHHSGNELCLTLVCAKIGGTCRQRWRNACVKLVKGLTAGRTTF